jgi:serine/threonine-protein kinase
LTLERLFDGAGEAQPPQRVPIEAVKPPSALRPEIPKALDDIVLHALALHPQDRYATAREMAADLLRVAPIAAPHEVGEWVEACAHERIAVTLARIAELESDALRSHPSTASPHRREVEDPSLATMSSVDRGRLRTSDRRPFIGIALGALFLAGALSLVAMGARDRGASATTQPPPPAPSPQPPLPLEPEPATNDPIATRPAATATPRPAKAQRKGSAAAPSTALPARGPDCEPPYTRATDGTKVWKLECF